LFPAGLFQQVKWDKLPSGFDDTMTAWLVRLPVRIAFGPFVALLEGTYGQNIGGGAAMINVSSGEASFGGYQRDATGKILNSNTLAGFFDLSYKIGPLTPHVFAGGTQSKNSDKFKAGNDYNLRTVMGANVFYTVTPNFTIIPEFAIYDLGEIPGVATKPKLGGDWLAGVQFRFQF
jgi:hypothetical protein